MVQPVLIDGAAGVVTTRDREVLAVGAFTVRDGRIVDLDFLADPERLSRLDLAALV